MKACSIYKNERYYKIVPNYSVLGGYRESTPILILPYNTEYCDLVKAVIDVLNISANTEFKDVSASEFLKAIKERSWKSLYTNNTSCLIELEIDYMSITPYIPSPYGRGLIDDTTNKKVLSFENTSAREIWLVIESALKQH